MLDAHLEKSLNTAFAYAREQKHEFLTLEHLLYILIENPAAQKALQGCGTNLQKLANQLKDVIDGLERDEGIDEDSLVQPTLAFQRVLQRAVFHVQSAGRNEVTGANLLVAMFSEQDTQAVALLKSQGVTRLDVVNYLAHGGDHDQDLPLSNQTIDLGLNKNVTLEAKKPSPEEGIEDASATSIEEEPTVASQAKSVLDTYGENLNLKAQSGKIDPLIGREDEVDRVIQVICRRSKNNPLLVGEAGVGKTAIAEGLAKKIVEGDVPDVIKNARVYSLDLGGMLAGTKYRGDFEKRLKGVLKQLQMEKHAILFIDEIHTIIGAGSAGGGTMDVANMIKPLLTKGNLRCIGSTTYTEYNTIFEKDHALARRFQKIDVAEPTIDQTYQILKGLKPYFESHHHVTYTDAALKAAANLAAKHISESFMPDKAIDVIDEAGAFYRMQHNGTKRKRIDIKQIEEVIAKIARIPTATVSASDKASLQNLGKDLKMLVYGQDQAVETLVSTIKLARAGLRDPNKPWGSFLFAGPTGVGKTEVTQQLSKLLGIELLRFDMSEYMEKHTVSRLIGAPPGYVGYDQGGLLTDAVMKHPYAVLLLDEIEKAHPDIYNILLQVMDNGFLTDSNGRKVDFRHTILIMTTNAGASATQRTSMGFAEQDHQTDGLQAVNQLFSPEFRNRLDAVVQFQPLTQEIVINVVDKFIAQLQGQLDERSVSMEVDQSARQWLAKKGYDPKMGARPMSRVIQKHLKEALANEILFGCLSKGGRVKVSASPTDDNLIFAYDASLKSFRKK